MSGWKWSEKSRWKMGFIYCWESNGRHEQLMLRAFSGKSAQASYVCVLERKGEVCVPESCSELSVRRAAGDSINPCHVNVVTRLPPDFSQKCELVKLLSLTPPACVQLLGCAEETERCPHPSFVSLPVVANEVAQGARCARG